MPDGTLELLRISDADLVDWLYLHSRDIPEKDYCDWKFSGVYSDPLRKALAQSREILEYEILQTWDRECDAENWSEEERAELPPAISPYWLYRVESARSFSELDSLPPPRLEAYLNLSRDRIWQYRAKNLDAIVARRMPSLPKPLPLNVTIPRAYFKSANSNPLSAGNSRARGK